MQGLTIIVAGADEERFRSALEVVRGKCSAGRTTGVSLPGAAFPAQPAFGGRRMSEMTSSACRPGACSK
jgi:hypothetical protein